jgi:hypothetical protein
MLLKKKPLLITHETITQSITCTGYLASKETWAWLCTSSCERLGRRKFWHSTKQRKKEKTISALERSLKESQKIKKVGQNTRNIGRNSKRLPQHEVVPTTTFRTCPLHSRRATTVKQIAGDLWTKFRCIQLGYKLLSFITVFKPKQSDKTPLL